MSLIKTGNWFNDIARNGTLVLYREFEQYFEYENYLTELPSKLRIPLARLRLSSHQLLIETGRYSQNRTERAQRLWTLCRSILCVQENIAYRM